MASSKSEDADPGAGATYTTKGELYRRINELEEENDFLGNEILAWRKWYSDSYKPQIDYMMKRIEVL